MSRATLVVSIFFGLSVLAWSPLSSRYYSTSGTLYKAETEVSGDIGTSYHFNVLLINQTDSLVVMIPMPKIDPKITIEYSGTCSHDSIYVSVRYGALFDISVIDTYEMQASRVLEDTLLYWYKGLRRHKVPNIDNLFPARYFYVAMSGSSKLPAAGVTMDLRITIR